MDKNIIYVLSDPLSLQIRYVGKTTRSTSCRLSQHLSRAVQIDKFGKYKYKQYVYCWLRSMLQLGLIPLCEVVEECSNAKQLLEAEIFYISYFKTLGFDLTNLTEGGEGAKGYTHTEESRHSMSVLSKLRVHKLTGPLPMEIKLSISSGNTGLSRI